MKKTGFLMVAVLAVSSGQAFAADNTLHLPFSQVLELPEAQAKLDGSVKFYLDGAATPAVKTKMGSGVSNKKTNGVGKSDELSCGRAALSALLAFQGSATKMGANAVVNLVSYYKQVEFKSSTEYECHVGGVIVAVAFKGDYATVGK